MEHEFRVRWYQQPFHEALVNQKKKRLIEVAHRRWGKDEIILNGFRELSQKRVGTYWHCFPEYAQARKAIWNGINGHTGKRRIDEAFPPEIRKRTNDNDMFIETIWGSTWQLLGSDRYDATVGSGPVGIAYSEWALCNPAAWAYHKPMIEESDGVAAFITTPRGNNHAKKMIDRAISSDFWFAEISTIDDTNALSPEQLAESLAEYQDLYGVDLGTALFQQEYYCSFDSAILGAYYGAEITAARNEGRITTVKHDPNYPVYAASDIGKRDATAWWIYQVIGGEVRILEAFAERGKNPDYFIGQLTGIETRIDIVNNEVKVIRGASIPGLEHRQAYDYKLVTLPHDGKAKTFATTKSAQEQLSEWFGWDIVRITSGLSFQDGITAARVLLRVCVFDRLGCEDGIEALTQYQHEWDDKKKIFKDSHLHDWTSDWADAFRYMAINWHTPKGLKSEEKKPIKGMEDLTLNELWKTKTKRRRI